MWQHLGPQSYGFGLVQTKLSFVIILFCSTDNAKMELVMCNVGYIASKCKIGLQNNVSIIANSWNAKIKHRLAIIFKHFSSFKSYKRSLLVQIWFSVLCYHFFKNLKYQLFTHFKCNASQSSVFSFMDYL